MKKSVLFLTMFVCFIKYSYAQDMVDVNRWVSPVVKDFVSIPANKGTDAQLISWGYTGKVFQYKAYLTRPDGNNVATVNRWEMPNCKEFIIIAEHEISDQKMTEWGYKNKQFVFYAYKTRPAKGSFMAVNRWVNALPKGSNCKDFTFSVTESELTDGQLTSWGYSSKLTQFYVPTISYYPDVLPILKNCITVYEQPNYQGRSQSYCDVGDFTAPFIIRSIRVPNGYLLNAWAGEFPQDYTADRNDFMAANYNKEIKIRKTTH